MAEILGHIRAGFGAVLVRYLTDRDITLIACVDSNTARSIKEYHMLAKDQNLGIPDFLITGEGTEIRFRTVQGVLAPDPGVLGLCRSLPH